jgi:hypothetical protein
VAKYGVTAISDRDECLRFIGSRGYCNLLLSAAGGAFRDALDSEKLLVLLTEGQNGEGSLPPQASLSYFASSAFLSSLILRLPFLGPNILQSLVDSLHREDHAEIASLVHYFQCEAEVELKKRSLHPAHAPGLLRRNSADCNIEEPAGSSKQIYGRLQSLAFGRPVLAAAHRVTELYLSALLLREVPCDGQCACVVDQGGVGVAPRSCISDAFQERFRTNLGWFRAEDLFSRALDYGRTCAAAFIKAECLFEVEMK